MGENYDGWLTKEDGQGKWWEGLDPQKLYCQDHPLSKGSWADYMVHNQWAWKDGAALPSVEFVTNFYDRTLDVINRYDPDLLYFDVTELPFNEISDAGLKIAAHFYNRSSATRGGKPEAVMFGKILKEEHRKAITWDVEKGAPNEIIPNPWQSCTCIGGWHYNTAIYESGGYKSAAMVAKLLVDIVSKNGNLLLSVPLRSDGTFDEKEKAILDEFGAWMRINSESIYDTRPWRVFGEGPIADADIAINAQGFNEGSYTRAGADEIRFAQKGKVLYATALAWPEGRSLLVKSLAKDKFRKVRSVELLGYGRLKFSQSAEGLRVTLPEQRLNDIAPVLKIR